MYQALATLFAVEPGTRKGLPHLLASVAKYGVEAESLSGCFAAGHGSVQELCRNLPVDDLIVQSQRAVGGDLVALQPQVSVQIIVAVVESQDDVMGTERQDLLPNLKLDVEQTVARNPKVQDLDSVCP